MDMEKIIRIIDELNIEAQKEPTWKAENALKCLKKELLKEQENEITDKAITVDVSIPEQFWPNMRYDPSEDVVACTSCLICGKDIPLRRYESGPRVCSECKEVIALLKEQEVELCDRCGRRRLKSNRVEGR